MIWYDMVWYGNMAMIIDMVFSPWVGSFLDDFWGEKEKMVKQLYKLMNQT